ncbi:DNA repair and recombination protein RadB [Candidatus Pacearchaeota archaeon CG10_big_fil_rev_8_21_14_0_10_31_9]|nr:MAG: DNA repair and recombination protein RadB [Candidatus Pacearchaeota archaeon CG1_02_32_21]PIN94977.1 MAG: DNA repair and recombination protein RadB [Candidatus Pacearchaeota archaeon CG10_big_fil_rev_8_21_14_0_10_31_9]PIZ82959.1 MAG: DNA repair and recombination protein RadB [Candidatus Pacearchaeota archaeon CG_4_10_14_0_2_um_filter_05_32_18]
MKEEKISAGSYDLNKWLFGGYEKDIITTIYGPAGSGKTNLCVLASVSQAKKGNKVIFIDTEGGFSVDRFKQISGEEDSLSNLLILKPTNFEEQKKSFDTLLKTIKSNTNVSLIVVDSMTMLYRLELSEKKDNNIKELNSELSRQLRTLSEIARNKQIPIIITNQVYYSFLSDEEFQSGKQRDANMVGGDILRYWSKCLIELQNSNSRRKAILRKHRSLPEKELEFSIDNKGVRKRGLF